MNIIKQIKGSYDRVGLHVEDDIQEVKLEYATPERRETELETVGWSPNLFLEHIDFLKTRRTVATGYSRPQRENTTEC